MVKDIIFPVRKGLNYNFILFLFAYWILFLKVHRIRVISKYMHLYIELYIPENEELSQTAKDKLRVLEVYYSFSFSFFFLPRHFAIKCTVCELSAHLCISTLTENTLMLISSKW